MHLVPSLLPRLQFGGLLVGEVLGQPLAVQTHKAHEQRVAGHVSEEPRVHLDEVADNRLVALMAQHRGRAHADLVNRGKAPLKVLADEVRAHPPGWDEELPVANRTEEVEEANRWHAAMPDRDGVGEVANLQLFDNLAQGGARVDARNRLVARLGAQVAPADRLLRRQQVVAVHADDGSSVLDGVLVAGNELDRTRGRAAADVDVVVAVGGEWKGQVRVAHEANLDVPAGLQDAVGHLAAHYQGVEEQLRGARAPAVRPIAAEAVGAQALAPRLVLRGLQAGFGELRKRPDAGDHLVAHRRNAADHAQGHVGRDAVNVPIVKTWEGGEVEVRVLVGGQALGQPLEVLDPAELGKRLLHADGSFLELLEVVHAGVRKPQMRRFRGREVEHRRRVLSHLFEHRRLQDAVRIVLDKVRVPHVEGAHGGRAARLADALLLLGLVHLRRGLSRSLRLHLRLNLRHGLHRLISIRKAFFALPFWKYCVHAAPKT